MPANLPPQYYEIERRFREEATTPEEKIACVEELLAVIPKHKGTDHMCADLRKRLSKLRAAAQSGKRSTRQQTAFHIDREGAGRASLVGPPNVGKSALVAALTHATPEVSEAPYSTWTPTTGMMPMEDIQIQLLDTPPIAEHVEPELYNLVRNSDTILAVVDLQADPVEQLATTVAALEEHWTAPHHHQERFAEESRMTLLPFIVVVNKADDETLDEDVAVFGELLDEPWTQVAVSATTGRNLEQLARVVYETLDIMRVYSKPPRLGVDRSRPFVLKPGATVEDFAGKVHKDLLESLKTARVWGEYVHDGQVVGRDHVLYDGDVVELHAS